ncbi:MAG TPA: hypothetical protein VGO94_08905 [Mycobacteriales bacterium]|jgi:hypothetical protein|nr:hypothetical protein [Mycobacteriales bacterium]
MTTRYSYTDPATGAPVLDCEHCIDGHMPGHLDPLLGSYFVSCPHCDAPCPACGGRGVYVDACCLAHFGQRLHTERGLRTFCCRTCNGITRLLDPTGRRVWP